MRKTILVSAAVVLAVLYLWNASWLAPVPEGEGLRLIAHRGVHQASAQDDDVACPSSRIAAPRHGFIENTVASVKAAFEAGADVVEIDAQTTRNGDLVAFNDRTLDCRTEAFGEIAQQSLRYLRQLDVGFGYTTDGEDHPLRGQGEGLLPTVSDVLSNMPEGGRLLVDLRADATFDADMLVSILSTNPRRRNMVWMVHGSAEPVTRATGRIDELQGFTWDRSRSCLLRYALLGWLDYIPDICRQTAVFVPVDLAPWLWGWPNRFWVRMRDAGSEIVLAGHYDPDAGEYAGLDDPADLASVPAHFSGYLWTDRIEEIGPALGRGRFPPDEEKVD